MFQMRANIVAMGVIGAALLLPELAQAEQVGHASWYALRSRTASGEMMNPSAMTAAHRSLPFGTKVLVENLSNGKAVVVRINDRGPFIKGRIIDVSKAAASSLGMLGSGTARVRVVTSGGGSPKVAAKAESAVKVASASTKMESASSEPTAKAESAPVVIKSAKMEGAPATKPIKVASASSKPAKIASASGSKSTKTAKASSKSTKTAKASSKRAKIVTASKSKGSVKSEKRSVAGLMKSTWDLKRVASRANSRKTYAAVSPTGARKAVAVASREFSKGRRGHAKAIVLASSANPYGAFVRSASFVN